MGKFFRLSEKMESIIFDLGHQAIELKTYKEMADHIWRELTKIEPNWQVIVGENFGASV